MADGIEPVAKKGRFGSGSDDDIESFESCKSAGSVPKSVGRGASEQYGSRKVMSRNKAPPDGASPGASNTDRQDDRANSERRPLRRKMRTGRSSGSRRLDMVGESSSSSSSDSDNDSSSGRDVRRRARANSGRDVRRRARANSGTPSASSAHVAANRTRPVRSRRRPTCSSAAGTPLELDVPEANAHTMADGIEPVAWKRRFGSGSDDDIESCKSAGSVPKSVGRGASDQYGSRKAMSRNKAPSDGASPNASNTDRRDERADSDRLPLLDPGLRTAPCYSELPFLYAPQMVHLDENFQRLAEEIAPGSTGDIGRHCGSVPVAMPSLLDSILLCGSNTAGNGGEDVLSRSPATSGQRAASSARVAVRRTHSVHSYQHPSSGSAVGEYSSSASFHDDRRPAFVRKKALRISSGSPTSAGTVSPPDSTGNSNSPPSSGQDIASCKPGISSHPLCGAVTHAQELLAAKYTNVAVCLRAAGSEQAVTGNEVYVPNVILRRPDLRAEFQEHAFSVREDTQRWIHVFAKSAKKLRRLSLHRLFTPKSVAAGEEDEKTGGVLAAASAGCGKTFLFTRVCPLKWAAGRLWPECDLLFARELRFENIRLAKGISDLLGLESIGIHRSDEREEICDFVLANPSRVCLVLDGLDEAPLGTCSDFVHDVIHGRSLTGIRLIVTSRPGDDVIALAEQKHFATRVELTGFTPSGVEAYIHSNLAAQDSDPLLKQVESDRNLANMMSTPLIANEVCKLYRQDGTVPKCVASLFQSTILQVAKGKRSKKLRRWQDVPRDIQKSILSVGSLAFHMLLKQRVVFTDADLQEHNLSDEAIALGLLISCDPLPTDTTNHWRFSHVTMQECLAGTYQAHGKPVTEATIVQLTESLGPLSKHLQTFWAMLSAQLEAREANWLLHSLLTRDKTRAWNDDDGDDGDELEALATAPFPLCYVEPLCEMISDTQMYRLAEELLSTALRGKSGKRFVENKLPAARRTSNVSFLVTLFQAWEEKVPGASREMLISALRVVNKDLALACQSHTVPSSCYTIPSQDLSRGKRFPERRMLVLRCFAEFALSTEGDVKSLPCVEAMLRQQQGRVRLTGQLHPDDGKTLDVVIRHCPWIVEKLRIERFTPTSICQLPASIELCSHITHLTIKECESQQRTISEIIQGSSCTLRMLEIFYRNGSILTNEERILLTRALRSCQSLQWFDLWYCKYQQGVGTRSLLAWLAAWVRRWRSLKGLGLFHNDFRTARPRELRHFQYLVRVRARNGELKRVQVVGRQTPAYLFRLNTGKEESTDESGNDSS